MVNVWDYVGAKKIRITDEKNRVHEGSVVAVFDSEETYDDEDSIVIVNHEGKHIGFFPSEIQSIEHIP